MFRYLLLASAFLVLGIVIVLFNSKKDYSLDEATLSEGKKLFTTHCISCHGIEEDGIGPRLGGITSLLSEKGLMDFIRNPEKVIASGNERARALHAKYKQTMPSYEWLDDEAIHSILSYIDQQTLRYKIQTLTVNNIDHAEGGLTGRLVAPVKKSNLKIELEDYIQIPRLKYSTPDLGIVTLRSHPSGDGRLYVSDQGGIIYEIKNNRVEIFLDLRSHVKDFSIGPGLATGLGSFDFHPDYLNNGLLYITHAEKYTGQRADYRISDSLMAEVQWVLSEWKCDDINAGIFKGTRRELLRLHAPTFGHGAQDIGFIPDLGKENPEYGLVYWGFGDGGSNNIRRPELGHHLKSFLGTILRIDPAGTNSPNGKYGIPPDNPFASDTGAFILKEIFAYGFRNPHRMSWDAGNNNRMLVTDIGESNIEEINIVETGGDYGWPGREGNFGISTKKDLKTVSRLAPSDLDLYKRPFIQYDHVDGFAVSGGYVYEGELEKLKGKYVFGDIVNGKLFYTNIDKALTDSAVYELIIVRNGSETTLREMSGEKRLHLRIAYDRFGKQLYVITKVDGMIRRVAKATF
ncbi:MAG: PQQ-dependent sugar dehydrogenase [Cyclobacteriaceae bacterium]